VYTHPVKHLLRILRALDHRTLDLLFDIQRNRWIPSRPRARRWRRRLLRLMIKQALLLAVILLLSIALFPAHAVPTYTPHQGDSFSYYEAADVGSGTGPNYGYGYTDHTVTNGMERMNGGFVNVTVTSNYTYTSNWNDKQGSPSQTQKSPGTSTWSST